MVEIGKDRYENSQQNHTLNSHHASPVAPPYYGDYNTYYIRINQDHAGNIELEDREGNRISVKKDIFDNYEVDNGKDRFTIRKDVLGYLSFTGSRGQRADFKKNVFDTRTYTDNRGNKLEYKKEYWSETVARYGDEQLLFISLINKHLYGVGE